MRPVTLLSVLVVAAVAVALVVLFVRRRQAPGTPVEAGPASADGAVQVRLGAGQHTEDEGPTLRFRIGAVHPGVSPAPQAPFFAPGGEWTFFEAVLESEPSARFTVGVHAGRPGQRVAFGKAVLAVASPEAGAALVRAVASTFGAELPAPRTGSPLEPFTFGTAVLGEGLARRPGGSFAGQGTWTATKWFLQLEGRDAEVYFNYDLGARAGELTEKDADYAQDLADVLAMVVRDGRPPERSPANDPSLADSGPRFEPVRQVASARATVLGLTPDGEGFLVTERTGPRSSVLLAVSAADAAPRELLRAEGIVDTVQCLSDGSACVVKERLPSEDNALSSEDPARLWWLDLRTGQHTPLQSAELGARPDLAEAALSPDGRYVATLVWRETQRGARARDLVLLDRTAGTSVRVPGGRHDYDVKGWEGRGATLRARLAAGYAWDPPQKRVSALADPATGTLTPTAAPPPPGRTSPDGARRWAFADGVLTVTETRGGAERTLRLHADDTHAIAAGEEEGTEALTWVSPRYLELRGETYVLVDTDTLRASLPLKRDARAPLAVSRSFRSALLWEEAGLFLARVVLPEGR